MFASSAFAADPADRQKLVDTGNCVECDLNGTTLNGANPSLAILIWANLTEANLTEANLTKAIMNGAILCNTTMPDGSVIYSGC